jgi:uncharacterized protein
MPGAAGAPEGAGGEARRASWADPSTRPDPTRARWGLGEVVLGILVSQFLAGIVGSIVLAAGGWSADDIPLWTLALLQLPLWAGWIAALLVAANKGDGLVGDLGIRGRWPDAPIGLAIGVVSQVVVLPLLYLPVLELLGRDVDDLSAPAENLVARASGATGWVLLVVMVAIGAPVLEELFYRGLLLRSLQKRGMSDGWACVVSGVAFGAMHMQALQFFGLAVFGIVLAVLAVRTGRLGTAVWAHIGFNATTVLVLFLQR